MGLYVFVHVFHILLYFHVQRPREDLTLYGAIQISLFTLHYITLQLDLMVELLPNSFVFRDQFCSSYADITVF